MIVNITANRSLKLKETNDVINTIKAFCADDATIIHGTVFDDAMDDRLRVTPSPALYGDLKALLGPAFLG